MSSALPPASEFCFDHVVIEQCQACPRLRAWCSDIAQAKRKQFAQDTYWGKPVPSFGPWDAQLLVVGLAPAAHGANRTGRMFTGDRSGEWLYRALHKAGFASQPESISADDGLTLINARITAVCHCAPPDNKPLPAEIRACRPYLHAELLEMPQLKAVVALGKVAFDAVIETVTQQLPSAYPDSRFSSCQPLRPKPAFAHGQVVKLLPNLTVVASYHPSQQNTFTKKLTEPMFDTVFQQVHAVLLSP